jgi:hypothetical protein
LGLVFEILPDIPCKALDFDGDKHSCGLVSNPKKYMPDHMNDNMKLMLGDYVKNIHKFGLGCDSVFVEQGGKQ